MLEEGTLLTGSDKSTCGLTFNEQRFFTFNFRSYAKLDVKYARNKCIHNNIDNNSNKFLTGIELRIEAYIFLMSISILIAFLFKLAS